MISVIADIGGLLGLFLGCSLLSIVEIFYFLTYGIANLSKRNKVENETPQITKTLSLIELNVSHDVSREEFYRFTINMRKSLNELKENFNQVNVKVKNLEENAFIL